MRSTTFRWSAAGLSCLAGGALALAPFGAALASAGDHGGAAKRSHHARGLFIVDSHGASQKIESYGTPSSLVRDSNGAEHVVTTKATAADPTKGNVVYLVRDTDKGGWKAHSIPGQIDLAGGVQVQAFLTQGGRRIAAVLFECSGVYVTDASINAHRLPVPSQVYPQDNCASPPDSTDNPPVALAGNTGGAQVSILLPGLLPSTYSLYSGTPGANPSFTPGTALPTTDNFTPVQLAVDPVYGSKVVVGTGNDGTNNGIYVTTQNAYSTDWSDPVEVATLTSASTDYSIEAVVTFNHHVYIGLSKPGAGLKHRLFLVKGQRSGQWLGTIPLAHSTGNDHNLRLGFNLQTHHLHAAWTRIVPGHKTSAKSGLMQEGQSPSGWNKPYFLTHWYRDVVTQITLTPSGHALVGYNQR